MQKRLVIKNSKTIEPDADNCVIIYGTDTLKMSGTHSIERYIDFCEKMGMSTLVFRR